MITTNLYNTASKILNYHQYIINIPESPLNCVLQQ